MEKLSEIRDELASKMFSCNYRDLSSWGQRSVDVYLARETRIDAPHNTTLPVQDIATLTRDNEKLASTNDQLREENLDLWEENQELRAELEELRAQFNPPS